MVLTDLHMPDMGGVEAIAVLRQINPGVKIIVVTGPALRLERPPRWRWACKAYIKKPFEVAHLLVTLQNVLQGQNISMKSLIAAGAILLVILNGLLLIPATGGHAIPIAALALVLALLVLVFSFFGGKSEEPPANPSRLQHRRPHRCRPIQPPAPTANQAEAEIVAFFGLLQEKGRLVDFLMEDITRLRRFRSGRRRKGDSSGLPTGLAGILSKFPPSPKRRKAHKSPYRPVIPQISTDSSENSPANHPSRELFFTRDGRPNS